MTKWFLNTKDPPNTGINFSRIMADILASGYSGCRLFWLPDFLVARHSGCRIFWLLGFMVAGFPGCQTFWLPDILVNGYPGCRYPGCQLTWLPYSIYRCHDDILFQMSGHARRIFGASLIALFRKKFIFCLLSFCTSVVQKIGLTLST